MRTGHLFNCYRRKRIHFLLQKVRRTVSTEKEKSCRQVTRTPFFNKSYIIPCRSLELVTFLACWKWFNSVLKEAGLTVTDTNREKIDGVIHKYIGEQASYGRCSANWTKARKEIQANDEMRQELIQKLRALV